MNSNKHMYDVVRKRLERYSSHPSFNSDALSLLQSIVWCLMQEDGCPWDRVQTHESIAQNLIEESYEAVSAIEEKQVQELKEELGDLLLQVLLHAEIARKNNEFNFLSIVSSLSEKLVRRHPHVFGEEACVDSPDEVQAIWTQVKQLEHNEKAESYREELGDITAVDSKVATERVLEFAKTQSLLSSIPKHLPTLMQAQKISKRAASVGFDWKCAEDVLEKISEEIDEFVKTSANTLDAEEEFGDILFTLINIARHKNIDTEKALRVVCQKFRLRFALMELMSAKNNRTLEQEPDLEVLWDRAKRIEKVQRAYNTNKANEQDDE